MKQKRGLRVREIVLMICVLFSPSLIMAFRAAPYTPIWGWRLVALVVNAVIALVLTCVVEDALERRGRFVDSGASWEEIWSRLSYAAPMVNCFVTILVGLAIWRLSDDVSKLGLLVAMNAAIGGLNIIFRRRN